MTMQDPVAPTMTMQDIFAAARRAQQPSTRERRHPIRWLGRQTRRAIGYVKRAIDRVFKFFRGLVSATDDWLADHPHLNSFIKTTVRYMCVITAFIVAWTIVSTIMVIIAGYLPSVYIDV